MSKLATSWHSERLGREMNVVRWGEAGTPLLLFPTAGGDAEECERFLMIDTLSEFLSDCRLKVYAVDSVAGEAWLKDDVPAAVAARIQNQFDGFIAEEVVPAIRTDCQDDDVQILTAGASIGAYNALAAITRHPDLFTHAICMSGTYDLSRFVDGQVTGEYYFTSPLHFVPDMRGEHLDRLRERFVLLTHGEGNYEDPGQSWKVAQALGAQGVPNRVDSWGEEYHHDWPTWREMLPKYLEEFLPKA